MSLSPLESGLLSLGDAAQLLPHRPHPLTLQRWARTGSHGVRLRTLVVGGRRFTTRQFLEQFILEVSAQAEVDSTPIDAQPSAPEPTP